MLIQLNKKYAAICNTLKSDDYLKYLGTFIDICAKLLLNA